MRKLVVALIASSALLGGSVVVAQGVQQGAARSETAGSGETEAGIPVTDPFVIEKCGSCHAPDDKGNLSRISWVRTTPEGWAQVVRRMGRLNGLQLEEGEVRRIIRSLSSSHGLAPEEAKPVMYLPERRLINETNIPNETIRGACASCHAFAQPMSWRRSKAEWQELQTMHVALYAQADVQYRRRAGDTPPSEAGKTPGQVALEYLSEHAKLHTPEWTAWRTRMATPNLAGRWLVLASAPGKGRFVGEFVVEPGGERDEFRTRTTITPIDGGATLRRSGSGVVYAGYAWRGRSSGGAGPTSNPDNMGREARETVWFAPNQSQGDGRWFWGGYEEFGLDVKLIRAGAGPTVLGVSPQRVAAGAQNARLRIIGDRLPNVSAGSINLGPGVNVRRIVSRSASEIVVEVSVAADAAAGVRNVAVGSAVLEGGLPVYKKVDYMKVTPELAMARLGGEVHPKSYQQFEAFGFDSGPDGKPNTADDINLGVMDVDWSVEEFMSVYGDDDKDFVGSLNPAGLFTPASEEPNPARRFNANNFGNVWVVATSRTEKDSLGQPLKARTYLVVTVPAYQRWDTPEVAQ